jgi:signal transduction histidine kinase
LTPDQLSVVDRMAVSMTRLTDLVESVLLYTQIEAGRLTVEIETFDLHALAAHVLEGFRVTADHKKLSLSMDAPADLAPMTNDRRMVRLILFNLVGNAIKFTEQGGVQVALASSEEGHRLVVSDTGIGISREDRWRIFEPFEHLEPVRQKHRPGTGLGLTLVREMVTSLGGRVQLESEVGKGTCFTVTLPPRSTEA